MSQPRFKKPKPLRGKTRIERLAARIPNEEKLLELLDKELPEHRIQLFEAMAPHLRFRLSLEFNPKRLPEAPYTGDQSRIPQQSPAAT